MDAGLQSFAIFLSILWFLVYWILGGVAFAIIALLRLGRVRKVRFSCLFSLLAFGCAVWAAFDGVTRAKGPILSCVTESTSYMQAKLAVIVCGSSGIMWSFLIGAIVLSVGGAVIMALSQSHAKPWLILDEENPEGVPVHDTSLPGKKSKFF